MLNPVTTNAMKSSIKPRLAVCVFALIAAWFVVLAVLGAVRTYTPIPVSDMWDGNVEFFGKVSAGHWSAWWAPHNEHRIVLARMLFWLDMALFGGESKFLIVANYLLQVMFVVVFRQFLLASLDRPEQQPLRRCLTLYICACVFFWSQEGNLTWGFQSQFILAQLLPLSALLALYHSVTVGPNRRAAFVLAVMLGVASLGTMANGVLALPVLTLYAGLTRQPRARVLLLVALAIVSPWLYHLGFAPSDHSALEAIRQDPIGTLRFLLLYLGSPFYYIARNIDFPQARNVAAIFGAIFLAGSAWVTLREARQRPLPPLQLALLAFIVYIGGTAAGTTVGRVAIGEIQALSSRYTTPAMMAWCALLVLFAPSIAALGKVWRTAILTLLVLMLLCAVPEQRRAALRHRDEAFQQFVAGIAIGMHIQDDEQIHVIYPFARRAVEIGEAAVAQRISLYSHTPYQESARAIGSSLRHLPSTVCRGSIDGIDDIPSDPRFVRVRGWIGDNVPSRSPRPVYIVDGDVVVGYALAGQRRGDVAAAVGKWAQYNGFVGYIRTDERHKKLSIVTSSLSCRAEATPPPLPFTYSEVQPHVEAGGAVTSDVLQGNQWTGLDFEQSRFPGMHVYASLVHADADTGSVSLTLHRGSSVFYRSGPTTGKQILKVNNGQITNAILPPADHWVRLRFDDEALPDTFVVTFVDNGSGWGEWSAIAVAD